MRRAGRAGREHHARDRGWSSTIATPPGPGTLPQPESASAHGPRACPPHGILVAVDGVLRHVPGGRPSRGGRRPVPAPRVDRAAVSRSSALASMTRRLPGWRPRRRAGAGLPEGEPGSAVQTVRAGPGAATMSRPSQASVRSPATGWWNRFTPMPWWPLRLGRTVLARSSSERIGVLPQAARHHRSGARGGLSGRGDRTRGAGRRVTVALSQAVPIAAPACHQVDPLLVVRMGLLPRDVNS
jgi:hypothetical protein